jgi:hypothetical protein
MSISPLIQEDKDNIKHKKTSPLYSLIDSICITDDHKITLISIVPLRILQALISNLIVRDLSGLVEIQGKFSTTSLEIQGCFDSNPFENKIFFIIWIIFVGKYGVPIRLHN